MKVCSTVLACISLATAVSAQTSVPQTTGAVGAAPPISSPAPIPTQPPVDPEKAAAIRKMLELGGASALMRQTWTDGLERLRSVVTAALPPGDYRSRLVDLFLERARSRFEKELTIELAVPAFDKYFSLEEVRQLIEFYQTPLGQKSIAVMPKLMAELRDEGGRLGQKIGRESMMEVLEENPDLKAALQQAGAARNNTVVVPRTDSSTAPQADSAAAPSADTGAATNGQTGGAKRIQIGGAVQQAKIVSQVPPMYPPLARQAKVEGTVKLHVIVGTNGAVEKLEAISGPPLLVSAAMAAVKQWRYEPTLLNGTPVEVDTFVEVKFSLGDGSP